ncbi:MAG: insulinase family protein [Candidatus Schekmanbacteria bacterium]|nr:insulinase family protein [Candidatus Schekmanbacteria bacterium]
MSFRAAMVDAAREHARSRALYLYLVFVLVAVAIPLSLSTTPDDPAEAIWFEQRAQMPPEVARARLERAPRLPKWWTGELLPGEPTHPGLSTPVSPEENRLVVESFGSGVPLWTMEMPSTPDEVTIEILSPGGLTTEPQESRGVSELAAAMVDSHLALWRERGAEIVEALAKVDESALVIRVTCRPDRFDAVVHELAAVLAAPEPRQKDAGPLRSGIADRYGRQSLSVMWLAESTARRELLPDHPGSRGIEELRRGAMTIPWETAASYLRSQLAPGRMGIVVAGPVTGGFVRDLVARAFAGFANQPRMPAVVTQEAKEVGPSRRKVQGWWTSRGAVAAGALLLPEPGREPLAVERHASLAQAAFERLTHRIRRRGLVYSGALHGPVLAGTAVAYFTCFETSPDKVMLLQDELAAWAESFPGPEYAQDAEVLALATELSRNLALTFRTAGPGAVAEHLGSVYMRYGLPPLDPVAEAAMWAELPAAEVRADLTAAGMRVVTTVATVMPDG